MIDQNDPVQADRRDVQKSLISRFRRIQGQIRGIRRMVDSGEKSVQDIFIQLSAVKAALDRASMLVLENHMLNCLVPAQSPEDLQKQRDSLVQFIRNYKYGTFTSPYGKVDVDTLLQQAQETIQQVIDTILDGESENKCSAVLRDTSVIRDLLNSTSISLFEAEVGRTLFEDSLSDCGEQLEYVLQMAKKFIV